MIGLECVEFELPESMKKVDAAGQRGLGQHLGDIQVPAAHGW